MASIIRGTTPTFKYTFNTVDVTKITTAFLTIKSKTDLEKDLSDAVVGTNYLAWTLTQSETLALGDQISVMVNWKLQDGTRGASAKKQFLIDVNYKDVVI